MKSDSIKIGKRKLGLNSEARAGIAFAAIPVLGFAVFYLVPFIVMIIRTFSEGLATYAKVLGSEAFRLAAGNSLKFILVGVPLLLLISLGLALLLNRKFLKSDFYRAAFVLPLVLPSAAVVLVFQVFFDKGGVVNYLLERSGAETIDFLGTNNAFLVLLLLYVWKNMGYTIILILAGLTQIPGEYYEVARITGAGSLYQLRKITLPLMAPTFFFVVIISIVGTFKSFREAFVLGGIHPDDSIYMLQHFMNNNFANLNYPRLSVAAVMTFAVIFAFVLFMYLRQREGGLRK